jgi:Pyruvate/2-oxoacid:ferredoxin oxidoreductase delta subunit
VQKPFAITLDVGSSLANRTGSWRTERPVYVDLLPPCNHACPAGENIQQWLYDAEEGGGGYERAWRQIMDDNPFPAVMGRVCYHPCETACNRAQLDEAVGINSIERFLGDEAIRNGWQVDVGAERSGKRVLVVGAGPSGLSAAYHLVRLGHDVTVHDAGPLAGGRMRFGIPQYRLPRDVLDAEIDRIVGLGVRLELNTKVTSILDTMRDGGFDATALFEARRCLSCGNCFSCDNCFGVCPDNAVLKLAEVGHGYAFDLDYCKGCGICAVECPCGAIEMIPEKI